MHISIKFCLDFFITSRSIHVVLIGFQYIFVSFCILVYFVAFRILVYFVSLRFVSHFGIFRFVAFRFAFQYISFRFVRCVSISFRSLVQPSYNCVSLNCMFSLPIQLTTKNTTKIWLKVAIVHTHNPSIQKCTNVSYIK